MTVTAHELARIAESIGELKSRLDKQSASESKLLAVLGGIEGALVDTADAVAAAAKKESDPTALLKIVDAISRLKLQAPDVKVNPTINVPAQAAPRVEVHVPAQAAPEVNVHTQTWKTIKVTPERDPRTGDPVSYTITRVA
jgi:hypothetical protein